MHLAKQTLVAAAVANCLLLANSQAATIIVNSSSDTNSPSNSECTLRQAVRSANGESPLGGCDKSEDGFDTIRIDLPVNDRVIVIENGDLPILSDVSIIGMTDAGGAPDVIVDPRSTSRVFDVTAGEVFIRDMTLRSGSSSSFGGCIRASSSERLTLVNVHATTCHSSSGGGGVYIGSQTPTVEMTSVSFTENTTSSRGGGIHSRSPRLTMFDSEISENTANGGGGIFLGSFGELEATSTEIDSNSAQIGGGVYAYFSGNFSMRESFITNNSATLRGGGLSCYRSTCALSNTELDSNNAANDDIPPTVGDGGGAHLLYAALTISGGDVSRNSAAQRGGAIDSETYSTVVINDNADVKYNDSYNGGAIALTQVGSRVTINNATLRGNDASYTGGGILIQLYNNSVTITDSTVRDNSAVFGGAVFNNGNNTVTISNSQVFSNSVRGESGGVARFSNGQLYITDSVLSDNTADRNGGVIFGTSNAQISIKGSRLEDSYSGEIGAVAALSNANLTLEQSSVSGNYANVGAAAFDLLNSEVSIANSTLSGNNTASTGGTIHLRGTSNLEIRNSSIVDNIGPYGAIYGATANNEDFFIANTVIAGNSFPQCSQQWALQESNWGEDASCFGSALGDPMLGELELMGASKVHKPLSNSPLIGAANSNFCQGEPVFGLDQLGRLREPGRCTIGAFESIEPTIFFTIPTADGKVVVIPL